MRWLLINLFLIVLALVGAVSFLLLFQLVLILNFSSDTTRLLGIVAVLAAVFITGFVARWLIESAQERLNRASRR